MNTQVGRTSPTMRAISFQSPDFSPLIPARRPSGEMSVQGNPPAMTSTCPRQGFPSNVRTSSQIGKGSSAPSSCRAMRTCRQYSSSSTAQTVRHPHSIPPSTPPPEPAKRCSARRPCLSSTSYLLCPFMCLGGVGLRLHLRPPDGHEVPASERSEDVGVPAPVSHHINFHAASFCFTGNGVPMITSYRASRFFRASLWQPIWIVSPSYETTA